ncbi:XPA protein C-terminus-domain-containing protein [Sordaria brevicollis]|uniref:DNA repair protein RAD14 n=1 Tax=Sordaria brevicollis TaxID=83679 RepID=A0AAE0PBM6_SORBR|nr:XPA protein C-terminus-domain-containing protein [Sordaria brevicollis]
MSERASTPPARATRSTRSTTTAARPPSPPTPAAETRRIEESRLRVKDQRTQLEAGHRAAGIPLPSDSLPRTTSGIAATDDIQLAGAAGRAAGRKRPFTSISRNDIPASNRDARTSTTTGSTAGGSSSNNGGNESGDLRPISKKFTKYVDYNFSAMTDTKGGFLSIEDDPFNKHLSAPTKPGQPEAEQKPAHMTAAEWERMQLIRNLQRNKAGPYEPGISVLADDKTREKKKCRECGSLEIDFVWEETFGCAVCGKCKERYPEKYSLLTKTEAKEDYLLTDPELKDPELLPHLSKPNPHKSHWHDMMLFLRYQVEEYAFNEKWGSAEALDAEFEKREQDKKRRKEAKFKEKLLDLKRKTRTEAFRRNTGKLGGGGDGITGGGKAKKFGDAINNGGKHVHEWGRTVENEEGMTVKTCTTCGMEVEELEF